MQLLEQRIACDGIVKDHEVLMVGSFLNHQIDAAFVDKLAEELHRRFEEQPITKVLTIEASGIAIAYATALRFGVPMVFAKKTQSRNLAGEVYSASIRSFTRGGAFDAIVPKRFLGSEDHVLIVDDFLARGCALEGLIDIATQAGATIEGLGVVIEKGFEPGGQMLRKKGYRLESLAIVKSMNPDTGEIVFDHDCDPQRATRKSHMTPELTLEPVNSDDIPVFKQRLQTAFTQAANEAFPDFPEIIPPERDIDESLAAEGAEALQIVFAGERVGGAIVSGTATDKLLDFIFIDPAHQDKHLGYTAWQTIEARYPQATHWELVTPYHEKRNIHFYVNRCGFHITEYYNDRHRDPHFPQEEAGDYPGEDGGLFKFEKTIPRER